ncbi:hypothetical protein BGM26_10810 [Bacillus sp. FJAT-29790]|uniref:F510_1955 family glycosylhydrolase n=1 Tax=Bacillus sp. FJAT-29790 TaxID=1895002 RepID=UPI001C241E5B|nr:hypothetical protein [Bacillus sp. FJAT-29790]MBU8879475.1 hypothetical protein [Bacillus sp. FJAT-29790]
MKISKISFLPITFVFTLLAAGCTSDKESEKQLQTNNDKPAQVDQFEIIKAAPQQLDHIHGLGYPGNDSGLYVASHEGIKVFHDDVWLEGSSQRHDYMGFQAHKDGFFASGHPKEGSDLKNPLGLVKSIDKGASLEKLAFYGESDFHFLSAGFGTNAIYIINQQANSSLDPGVYFSENEGKSWNPVKLTGLESDTLGMIAAHPSKSNLMAMSTRSGIFLSEDNGEHMKRISEPVMTTALVFSENNLFYSSVENNKVLFHKIDLITSETSQIEIPFLNYDNPITYISVNNQNDTTLSFATYLNDVYESTDKGENWKLLLKNGRIE